MTPPQRPQPGGYQHYKGGLYRVLFTAQHSENPEQLMVVYESVDTHVIWVRPLEMFQSMVDTPEGPKRRFEWLCH